MARWLKRSILEGYWSVWKMVVFFWIHLAAITKAVLLSYDVYESSLEGDSYRCFRSQRYLQHSWLLRSYTGWHGDGTMNSIHAAGKYSGTEVRLLDNRALKNSTRSSTRLSTLISDAQYLHGQDLPTSNIWPGTHFDICRWHSDLNV